MHHIPLNDYLSDKSNWPRRLLGWEPFQVDRSAAHVSGEYDEDRYAPLLKLEYTRAEDCKIAEFELLAMRQDDPMFISFGEEVFRTDVRTARIVWYSMILSTVRRFASGRVCELGCGYGYNLTLFGDGSYGGEFSPKAVQLAHRLGLDVAPFNYYERSGYSLIRPGSTVVTVHSLEQIPKASMFVDHLRTVRENIREVIHLEPCFLPERKTLLGMIRNRYNELIDHNHDLVSTLRARSDVEILHFEPDVFGLHPLNSTNVSVWRFRD